MASDPKAPQQSPDFPDAFYRVTIKGLLVREGKLMLVQDFTNPLELGFWELPGGGLDFGEEMHEALKRELKEEMGLTVTWIADKPLYMYTQRREAKRNMEWHYVLVVGFPIEVENLDFTPSDEARDITFMSKDEMLANKEKIADQLHKLIDLFNPADFV